MDEGIGQEIIFCCYIAEFKVEYPPCFLYLNSMIKLVDWFAGIDCGCCVLH